MTKQMLRDAQNAFTGMITPDGIFISGRRLKINDTLEEIRAIEEKREYSYDHGRQLWLALVAKYGEYGIPRDMYFQVFGFEGLPELRMCLSLHDAYGDAEGPIYMIKLRESASEWDIPKTFTKQATVQVLPLVILEAIESFKGMVSRDLRPDPIAKCAREFLDQTLNLLELRSPSIILCKNPFLHIESLYELAYMKYMAASDRDIYFKRAEVLDRMYLDEMDINFSSLAANDAIFLSHPNGLVGEDCKRIGKEFAELSRRGPKLIFTYSEETARNLQVYLKERNLIRID